MTNAAKTPSHPKSGGLRRGAFSALIALVLAFGGILAASPANAVVVGLCTIRANNPHGSTHVTGTINAEGSLKCSVGMTEIYVRAYLENSAGTSWGGNVESWLSTPANKKYSSFANAQCGMGPGAFRTRVSYAFTSPPGISPSYSANTIYSPWEPVACGTSRLAGPTAPTGDWTTEQPLPKGITLTPTADGVEITFAVDEVAR